jgi:hypothetical protein
LVQALHSRMGSGLNGKHRTKPESLAKDKTPTYYNSSQFTALKSFVTLVPEVVFSFLLGAEGDIALPTEDLHKR